MEPFGRFQGSADSLRTADEMNGQPSIKPSRYSVCLNCVQSFNCSIERCFCPLIVLHPGAAMKPVVVVVVNKSCRPNRRQQRLALEHTHLWLDLLRSIEPARKTRVPRTRRVERAAQRPESCLSRIRARIYGQLDAG